MPIELDVPHMGKTAEEADRVKSWKNGYDKGWRDAVEQTAQFVESLKWRFAPSEIAFYIRQQVRQ